jgi:hypothetical protein
VDAAVQPFCSLAACHLEGPIFKGEHTDLECCRRERRGEEDTRGTVRLWLIAEQGQDSLPILTVLLLGVNKLLTLGHTNADARGADTAWGHRRSTQEGALTQSQCAGEGAFTQHGGGVE